MLVKSKAQCHETSSLQGDFELKPAHHSPSTGKTKAGEMKRPRQGQIDSYTVGGMGTSLPNPHVTCQVHLGDMFKQTELGDSF